MAQCAKYNADQSTDESFALATINRELLNKVRIDMPVIEHRRNDIYNLFAIGGLLNDISEDHYYFADKIIPGSTVFYVTDYSYAFTNIRCVVPGRILFS